ncbi:LytR C-terminal domain-containing protein [Streptomyces poriticola]|uniref:LytR C-terminal domain-containing protein n=1 Tax=Streptomyces poriticola TaxID=3120506 RepID=UPI002FCE10FD
MNDRYDAGYGDGAPYELVGYDEYGRPVYRQVPAQPAQQQPYDPYAQQQPYDPYAQQQGHGSVPAAYAQEPGAHGAGGHGAGGYAHGQQDYAHDPYATGDVRQPASPASPAYDPYGSPDAPGSYTSYTSHDTYTSHGTYGTAQQPQTAHVPQQAGPPEGRDTRPAGSDPAADEPDHHQPDHHQPDHHEPDHRTEQFAFVEEPDGDSEDVIDWLKFTENRTERREEAKRRARARVIALAVVLALVAAGGVGYLWYAGKLPGLSSSDGKSQGTTAAGAQKRDVLVVHLHDTKGGGTTTALLVDNTTTQRGTTVLIPNSLAVTADDGTAATLAESVDEAGPDATRTSLNSALGTDIEGTWRLDTPFLQILVDLVGNIEVDADADVPDPEAEGKGAAPLVRKGENQTLSGKAAVAYATHRGSGEAQNAQLERFGQVLHGVLRKLSSDPDAATLTVQTLGQVLDPPLTDKDLGAFLASLADLAKGGDHDTALLPVQDDGTLSAEASASVVKDVLGGTAKSPDPDAAVSVSVRNATGDEDSTGKARVVLLNGGFTVLQGGTAGAAQGSSEVVYGDEGAKEDAVQVAKTLGLPAEAVAQGEVPANADVAVVLGQDYEPSS